MQLVGFLGLLAVTAAAGCGGGSGGAMLACTMTTGTSRTCFEIYSSIAAAGGEAAAKMDCVNGGGVASDICPRDGADGGCKMTQSQGGITQSTTFWYYTGNAASEMQGCVSSGGTWIAP
jgi:hypothetical protein